MAYFGKVLNFAVPSDLSIDATVAPGPVVVGSTPAYTLTVNNAGPADAQNVVVTNTPPLSSTLPRRKSLAQPGYNGIGLA